MKIRVPDYFKDFKCIASECEDTCCAGWEVVVDSEAYKKYQEAQGEFGDRLRSSIINDGVDDIFTMNGRDCSFLDANGLCDIYKELGEGALCHTCKEYPRFTEEFGSLREIGLSLSCPEAARLILREDVKTVFLLEEVDEELTSFNDIDAMLFIYTLQCRKIIFEILHNREWGLEERIALALRFTADMQEKVDEDKIQELALVKEQYKDSQYQNEVVSSLKSTFNESHPQDQKKIEIIEIFKNLKHITGDDPLSLGKVIENLKEEKQLRFDYEKFDYVFEKIIVYFVYRYFLKGVFDFDILGKMKIGVASSIVIKELLLAEFSNKGSLDFENLVRIIQLFSKDVEHLEENIETLQTLFETREVFKVDELIKVLMA